MKRRLFIAPRADRRADQPIRRLAQNLPPRATAGVGRGSAGVILPIL